MSALLRRTCCVRNRAMLLRPPVLSLLRHRTERVPTPACRGRCCGRPVVSDLVLLGGCSLEPFIPRRSSYSYALPFELTAVLQHGSSSLIFSRNATELFISLVSPWTVASRLAFKCRSLGHIATQLLDHGTTCRSATLAYMTSP